MKASFWRGTHRKLGLILILPFLGWAATGLFFFIKPGYGPAYASLAVKRYPVTAVLSPEIPDNCLEYRVLQTVLGTHLLVRTDEGAFHLDEVGQERPAPGEAEVRALVADAISVDPQRYGSVERVEGMTAWTDTGVRISLNWTGMSLYQYGRDTKLIDTMYNIHYLKWTGVEGIDRVLGVAGLILLCLMTLTGVTLMFSTRARPQDDLAGSAGDRG